MHNARKPAGPPACVRCALLLLSRCPSLCNGRTTKALEANNLVLAAALARRGAADANPFENLVSDTADWYQIMFQFLVVRVLLCTQCHSFDSVALRCNRNSAGG